MLASMIFCDIPVKACDTVHHYYRMGRVHFIKSVMAVESHTELGDMIVIEV